MEMPKLKTHSGIKKRFKVTAKGKLKCHRQGKRHMLESKSKNKKRQMRKALILTTSMRKNIKKLLPYS
jgi:large subunit ribosomal protein L35